MISSFLKKPSQFPTWGQLFLALPFYAGFLFLPTLSTPVLRDPFTVPKWSFVYTLIALWGIVTLAHWRRLPSFILSKEVKTAAGLLTLLLVFNYFYLKQNFVHVYTLDRLGFVILVFSVAFSIKRKSIGFGTVFFACNFIATTYVLTQSVIEFYLCRIVIFEHDRSCYASTFGNINMMAQFLGFSLVFQLGSVAMKHSRFINFLKQTLIVLTLTGIYFSFCRSVYLGVSLLFLSVFFLKRPVDRRTLLLLLLVAGAFIWFGKIMIRSGNPYQGYKSIPTAKMKHGKSSFRLEMWKESLPMIKDFPMGLGIGGFEFGYIPYQMGGANWPRDTEIFMSPHNELLRLAVEDGVPCALLICIFLALLLSHKKWGFWRSPSSVPTLVLMTAIIFVTEFFIQFPLSSPYSFFVGAVFFGVYLGHSFDIKKSSRSGGIAFLLATGFMLFVTLFSRFFQSKYYEANFPYDEKKMAKACRVWPQNWMACANWAKVVGERNPTDGFSILRRELEKNPYNFVALEVWGIFELRQGQREDGCRTLLNRDLIFDNLSSQSPYLATQCQPWMDDFPSNPWKAHRQWMMDRGLSTEARILQSSNFRSDL